MVRPNEKKNLGLSWGMTQICIWCWGSNSWALDSVEYPFLLSLLPGPLLFGMVIHVGIPSMGPKDLFENYSYSVFQKKKSLKKQHRWKM